MKYPLIIAILLLFAGCNKTDDDSSYYHDLENTIYSTSGNVEFEELLILFNFPIVSQNLNSDEYLITQNIDYIKLKINNRVWAELHNINTDLQMNSDGSVLNFEYSNEKVEYLVVAGRTFDETDLFTAGDFAEALNGFLTLDPGTYVCEIAEIQITNSLGESVTAYPHIFQEFTLEADTKSLLLGEFDIELNID
jgi:hypothetical protein